ncbi:MAG TPA: Clp protease N-terminal domain-containing protein [Candidatus Acidoferrales bacterium]|nr:Clp protease N-terminal domain-containing protein [Candidatus Acidoferrales bacterium]
MTRRAFSVLDPNPLWNKLGDIGSADVFRTKMGPEAPPEEQIPTNKEIPLSPEAEQALRLAVEEAELRKQREIGTKHLLAGLLRIGDCRAVQILRDSGVDLERMVEIARKTEAKD